jgi:uncharacterized protein
MENMSEKKRIAIQIGELSATAEIYDTPTGNAILEILPISSVASRWGEEIYFSIPLSLPRSSDVRAVISMGELGYWPDGNAFCIFFGPTPASRGEEIRAASPVNVFGKIQGDPTIFTVTADGQKITVSRA